MAGIEVDEIQWRCHPEAEELCLRALAARVEASPFLQQLQRDLFEQTSTRLFDWMAWVGVERTEGLAEAGFVCHSDGVWAHPGAQLPHLIVGDEVAIAVESVADFLMVRGLARAIIEAPPYRKAEVAKGVWVVERPVDRVAYERWQTRPRCSDDEAGESKEFDGALQLAGQVDAHTMLAVERRYWQARNRAGQVQKCRQDRLGMGWANHDHHTFRSSRRRFRQLVQLLERFGFRCRERFYAGVEAGWGAQVMEHVEQRLVLFLDVDLAPHELQIDFAHEPLEELPQLGTIGLWCALHGESILKAGMHHLEAQFDFEQLKADVGREGVGMMAPFCDLPYLRQAFTVGEQWPVAAARVQRLLERGLITAEQAERFHAQGALGSHLENLQRHQGYKGFHSKGVSAIIRATDPRRG